MKKIVLSLLALTGFAAAQAQSPTITDSLSMGIGAVSYPHDVFYNLATGQKDTVASNNWHLAFAIRNAQPPMNVMLSTTVRTNEARGVNVYRTNHTPAQWAAFTDTTGLSGWALLHNSDSSWDIGALNSDNAGGFDFGWGQYNMTTHNVDGSKVYLLAIGSGPSTVYKKLYVQSLLFDTAWSFTLSSLNGSDSVTQHISKSSMPGKLFAYYNVLTHTVIDREPNHPWDLLFTYYKAQATLAGLPAAYYSFAGVLQAPQVSTAEVRGLPKATADTMNATGHYSKNIGTIGWDWKRVYFGPPPAGPYDLTDSLTYFMRKDNDTITYKLTFEKFTTSPTQVIVFGINTYADVVHNHTGIATASAAFKSLNVYPNPASDVLHFTAVPAAGVSNAVLSVYDLSGRMLHRAEMNASGAALESHINLSGFGKGMYFYSIEAGSSKTGGKFIVE